MDFREVIFVSEFVTIKIDNFYEIQPLYKDSWD
jgi:hypothetical protein